MRLLDAQYLQTPFYGSRRMTAWLQGQGYPINRKWIQRLMYLVAINKSKNYVLWLWKPES
jgi:putative transposase